MGFLHRLFRSTIEDRTGADAPWNAHAEYPESMNHFGRDHLERGVLRGGWDMRDGYRRCFYCGSLTCEDFVEAIERGDFVEVADWKYGGPHKAYVDLVNDEPGKLYYVGSRSVGMGPYEAKEGEVHGPDLTRKQMAILKRDGAVWDGMHGDPKGEDQFWRFGTKTTVHAKFYFEHLRGWNGLMAAQQAIFKRTGLLWSEDEKGLRYQATAAAYQRGQRF